MSIWKKIRSVFGYTSFSSDQTDEPVPIHLAENWEQYSVGEDVEDEELETSDSAQRSTANLPDPDLNFIPDYSLKPDAVCLNTDEYHLQHFGKTEDGKFVWLGDQHNYDHKLNETTDYIFKFIFDVSGELISGEIQTVGTRNLVNSNVFWEKMSSLIDENPIVESASLMIKPFKVIHEGIEFGLIVREPEDKEDLWAVEFMPGNTMGFFEPFDSGVYDT